MMTVMRLQARRGRCYASARTAATGLAIASFVTLCMPPVAWMLGVSFIGSDRERNLGHTDIHIQIKAP
jgi:hypothetical protein